MAATSSIKIMQAMGYSKWKFLQRTGYIALIFAAMHAFLLPESSLINSVHGKFLLLAVVAAVAAKIYSVFRRVQKQGNHFKEQEKNK